MASIITSRAGSGSAFLLFSSIIRVSSAWSSEPQFTPMRTGFWFSTAHSTITWKLSLSFLPIDALPGLIRYFASAFAVAGNFFSSRCPL